MGKTKPERSPESVAKGTKSMAKRTSLYYYFFLTRFFEADSEAGCKYLQVNMGKTKPERSPESVAKATTRMAKKLVCIIFFDAFF